MCLYPKLIKNRKYIPNKKNGGVVPLVSDQRVLQVAAGCGKCMECRKQKATQWSVRLQEEIRNGLKCHFVTLTFSDEKLIEVTEKLRAEGCELEGYDLDNAIATYAVRHYLENWRSKHGKSVRHWFITELGHTGTERVHLHGLMWTDYVEDIEKVWTYGYVFVGKYVNDETVQYVSKYINKVDFQHKEYTPKIMASAGIGSSYSESRRARLNQFNQKGETDETFRTRQGVKIALPIYFRNKIYTDEQREKLWLQKLDKQERWVGGERVDVSTPKGVDRYHRLVEYYRLKSKRLGYGTDEKDWNRKKYEEDLRALKKKDREEKIEGRLWKSKKAEKKEEPEWIRKIMGRSEEEKKEELRREWKEEEEKRRKST